MSIVALWATCVILSNHLRTAILVKMFQIAIKLNVSSISLCYSATGPRWWLRGRMTEGLANNIIALVQDMATVSHNL